MSAHTWPAMLALAEPVAGAGVASGGAVAARPLAVDLLIMLACAGVVAMVLRRLRLATIPAYLICGALIGPSALGLITSFENVESISGLAMVLLMFTIGLHLDPGAMRGGMIRTLTVGAVSTLAIVVVSMPFGLASGLRAPSALAVAMGISMSSTAVVLSLLQQRRETQRLHGRLCVGISITQDLLSLVFLALLPVLAQWAGVKPTGSGSAGHGAFILDMLPANTGNVWKAVVAVGGIALMVALGRLVLPPVLGEASLSHSSDVPLVVTTAAALGAAVTAAGLGFSPELGAFLAGFTLAGTQFRPQLAGQLSPMRDLFMAVFFTSVGLRLNLGELGSVSGALTVLLGSVVVISVKAFIIAATTWAMGATAAVAALVGLTLAQAGEFTIVVLTPASNLGLLTKGDFAIVIAIVVVTLIVTPMLNDLGRWLQPRLSRIPLAGWNKSGALRERMPEADHEHGASLVPAPPEGSVGGDAAVPMARYVVVAGFGIVGRALADRLTLARIPFCIVDLNRQTVETQRRLGRQAVYGDISNPEVLEAAGIHRADAVMLTIPDDEAMMRACEAVRRARPDVYIAVRTSFLSKAMLATALGADQVIVEEVATAETMARQVLEALRRRAEARAP